MFAVHLDNAALVDTSAVVVGDRLCGTSARRWRRHSDWRLAQAGKTALGPKFCPGLALPFFSGFLVLQPPLVLQPAALFIGALAFDHERLKPGLSISLTGKGSEVFAGLAGVFLILRLSLHCADHIPSNTAVRVSKQQGMALFALKDQQFPVNWMIFGSGRPASHKIVSDGPSRMVKWPTGSDGEPSSPNYGASAGVEVRHLLLIHLV